MAALFCRSPLLRGSWSPVFDPAEALAIYRKGAIRVPLVLSMWVVGYADIFILSRFVSDTDLGTYTLASRAAFLVAVLPGGYRKALRPLQKTTMFQAVEDEYGVGEAAGHPVRLLHPDARRDDAGDGRAGDRRSSGSPPTRTPTRRR